MKGEGSVVSISSGDLFDAVRSLFPFPGSIVFAVYTAVLLWAIVAFARAPASEAKGTLQRLARAAKRGVDGPAITSNSTPESLELSDSYRKSRRTTIAVAGAAVAWSLGQVEVDKVSGPLEIVLGTTSIAPILVIALGYLFWRSSLDFMMQPVPVRRWPLAQWDHETLWVVTLVGAAAIAGSPFIRSPVLLLAIPSVLTVTALLTAIVFVPAIVLCLPLMIWIRNRQRRTTISSRVIEAIALAWVIAAITALATMGLVLFAAFRIVVADQRGESFLVVLLGSLATVALLVLRSQFADTVFAAPPSVVVEQTEDGGYVERGSNLTVTYPPEALGLVNELDDKSPPQPRDFT